MRRYNTSRRNDRGRSPRRRGDDRDRKRSEKPYPYECVQCRSSYAKKEELSEHQDKYHKDEGNCLDCPVEDCQEKCNSPYNWRRHLATHLPKTSRANEIYAQMVVNEVGKAKTDQQRTPDRIVRAPTSTITSKSLGSSPESIVDWDATQRRVCHISNKPLDTFMHVPIVNPMVSSIPSPPKSPSSVCMESTNPDLPPTELADLVQALNSTARADVPVDLSTSTCSQQAKVVTPSSMPVTVTQTFTPTYSPFAVPQIRSTTTGSIRNSVCSSQSEITESLHTIQGSSGEAITYRLIPRWGQEVANFDSQGNVTGYTTVLHSLYWPIGIPPPPPLEAAEELRLREQTMRKM